MGTHISNQPFHVNDPSPGAIRDAEKASNIRTLANSALARAHAELEAAAQRLRALVDLYEDDEGEDVGYAVSSVREELRVVVALAILTEDSSERVTTVFHQTPGNRAA